MQQRHTTIGAMISHLRATSKQWLQLGAFGTAWGSAQGRVACGGGATSKAATKLP